MFKNRYLRPEEFSYGTHGVGKQLARALHDTLLCFNFVTGCFEKITQTDCCICEMSPRHDSGPSSDFKGEFVPYPIDVVSLDTVRSSETGFVSTHKRNIPAKLFE